MLECSRVSRQVNSEDELLNAPASPGSHQAVVYFLFVNRFSVGGDPSLIVGTLKNTSSGSPEK